MRVLSFSHGCILKGNILYNYNTGVRVYLGSKGLELIKKINEREGKIEISNKYERFFIEELKKVGLLIENENFIPIEKELENDPPHVIIWEPTTKCNFNCEYCYVKWFGRGNKESDLNALDRALKEIINSAALEVIITGGEPLTLGDKLKEIIWKLREAKKGIVLFTNGSLLDEEWLKFFKENNVRLHISLDTLLPEKDVRNPGLLYKILRNIIQAKKLGLKVVLQTTLHIKNIDYFNQVRYFAKILDLEIRYDIETPICPEMLFEFYSILPKFKELLKKLDIVPKKDHDGCGAGLYSIFIRSDGAVTPCTMFYNVIGGNIKEKSLTEILNDPQSEIFKEVQKICSSQFPTEYLEFCKKCPIKFMCNSGCRARSYLINKNIYGVDPKRCYVEKEILIKKAIEEGYVITLLSLLIDYSEVSEDFYKKALSRLLIEWERIVKENYIWYVTFDNKVEGIIIFNKKNEGVGTILWLVVSPKARNRGIGSFLLKKAEECLKRMGCKKIRLSANKVSLEFYLRNGYRIINKEIVHVEEIFILEKDI